MKATNNFTWLVACYIDILLRYNLKKKQNFKSYLIRIFFLFLDLNFKKCAIKLNILVFLKLI